MITKCVNCKKKIEIKNSWRLKKYKTFCCSRSCASVIFNKKNKNGVEIKCLNCRKKFYISKSRINKKRFCSRKCQAKWNVGKIPKNTKGLKLGRGWNKGKKMTKEWIDKLTKVRIGKPNLKTRGKNHWNWNNGATKLSRALRQTLEYKIWRRKVFERDTYTCVICFKKGGLLQADHIKPFSLYPELRLDVNNGRTLCFTCHKKTDSFPISLKQTAYYKIFNCRRSMDIGL